MGGAVSDLIHKEPGFEYMSITLRTTDKIRVVYASDQEVNIVRDVIQQTWPKGIQQEGVKLRSVHDFKLNGNPFMEGSSSEDASNARLLACDLLYRLHNSGWKLITSSDLARTHDLTTWFFQRSAHDFSPYRFGCISLSSWDKLQVSNDAIFLVSMQLSSR